MTANWKLWLSRGLAIAGLFGLITLICAWNGWFTPIQQVPLWLELLFFVLPLALLVKGILSGNAATHVHATLVSLLYLTFSVWFILTPQEAIYGYLMLLFSIMLYLGGFFGAKQLSKAQQIYSVQP